MQKLLVCCIGNGNYACA